MDDARPNDSRFHNRAYVKTAKLTALGVPPAYLRLRCGRDAPRSSNPRRCKPIGGAGSSSVTGLNAGLLSREKHANFEAVKGIEVIETEWGSELHQRLVAEEHAARVAWRDSPEAWEQARRMKEAGPLEIDWSSALGGAKQ